MRREVARGVVRPPPLLRVGVETGVTSRSPLLGVILVLLLLPCFINESGAAARVFVPCVTSSRIIRFVRAEQSRWNGVLNCLSTSSSSMSTRHKHRSTAIATLAPEFRF